MGLALDDFGTGSASLSHLRSVPLTIVKLDRQFVEGVENVGVDHEIVRNVIRLSHALGLRVVAEGVELESQRATLEALGCDAWQGHLHSPAVPADRFLEGLRSSPLQPGPADQLVTAVPDVVEHLDSFVLRRIGSGRWAHLGGHGRGEGWAGIVEAEESSTPILVCALAEGIQRIDLPELDIAVGHATNRGHESIEATVAAADTRMYAAKAAAKDSHGR